MKHNLVKKLGVGSAGDAYLMEDGRAIIIGKRQDSFETYKALFEKMQLLKGQIKEVKYPQIYELISPSDEYPFGAVIEDCIGGKELRECITKLDDFQKREVGRVLASFIAQIHSIKTEDRKLEEMNINLSKYDRSLSILKDFLPNEVYQKLGRLKDDYKQLLNNKDFCLTHGDLNAGNIMIDENGKVSGIIDFGNMEYYVPEIEFVHMYFFDSVIYNAMVENYPRKISEKEIVFLELVVNIRHFKNIKNFEDRKNDCLQNIQTLLKKYLKMQTLEEKELI